MVNIVKHGTLLDGIALVRNACCVVSDRWSITMELKASGTDFGDMVVGFYHSFLFPWPVLPLNEIDRVVPPKICCIDFTVH